jgi:hypothetical protein
MTGVHYVFQEYDGVGGNIVVKTYDDAIVRDGNGGYSDGDKNTTIILYKRSDLSTASVPAQIPAQIPALIPALTPPLTPLPDNPIAAVIDYIHKNFISKDAFDLTARDLQLASEETITIKHKYSSLLQITCANKDTYTYRRRGSDNNIDYYKEISFISKDPKTSLEKEIKLIHKDHIATGTFNHAMKYYNPDGFKEYVVRQSIKPEDAAKSLYENLKHIVLYSLIKLYYPHTKYKLVPTFYNIGINVSGTNKIIFTIMEECKMTLQQQIDKDLTEPIERDNKTLLSFHRALELLNTIPGIDPINFRHGDLKLNNVMLTKNDKPVLIDFGFAQFTLSHGEDKITFKSENTNMYYYTDYKLNITHDILQLWSSLSLTQKYYGINVYKLFEFKRNKNKYILENNVFKNYYNKLHTQFLVSSNIPDFKHFYNETIQLHNHQAVKFIPVDIQLSMKSDELAYCLNLDPISYDDFDVYTQSVIKKYLKYKAKYIQLKKLLN